DLTNHVTNIEVSNIYVSDPLCHCHSGKPTTHPMPFSSVKGPSGVPRPAAVQLPERRGSSLVVGGLGRGEVAAYADQYGSADEVVLRERREALGDALDVVGASPGIGCGREDLDRAAEADAAGFRVDDVVDVDRSEEHTSELQSR